MNCDINIDTLQDYLEGTIDPLERIFLETHITTCKLCRRELSELKLLFWDLSDKSNYETEFPVELDNLRDELVESITGKTTSAAGRIIDKQISNMKKTVAKQTPKMLKKATKSLAKGAKYCWPSSSEKWLSKGSRIYAFFIHTGSDITLYIVNYNIFNGGCDLYTVFIQVLRSKG
jgi:hypothetical protein